MIISKKTCLFPFCALALQSAYFSKILEQSTVEIWTLLLFLKGQELNGKIQTAAMTGKKHILLTEHQLFASTCTDSMLTQS